MSLQQAHPRTGRTLLDRLPMAMTVSRLWMYSHRASSMTRALFIDGMAGKSKVSRLLTVGNRAARIRRSTMRWRRSMSSSSTSRSRYPEWFTLLAAHWAVIFPYSLRKLGLCRDCGATVIPAQTRCPTCARRHRVYRRLSQYSVAYLRPLEPAAARLSGDRPGGPLRGEHGRFLRLQPGGQRAVPGGGRTGCNRQSVALSRPRDRLRQRQRDHQRHSHRVLRRTGH